MRLEKDIMKLLDLGETKNVVYTGENLKKMGLSERQIKAVMYVKEKGRITNKEYQEINKCFRNTVTNDLIDKGVLKASGKKGKGAYYVIAH